MAGIITDFSLKVQSKEMLVLNQLVLRSQQEIYFYMYYYKSGPMISWETKGSVLFGITAID